MATDRRFKNRMHAGKLLAVALAPYAGRADALVLALPRGGVPVAFAIARALGLALDVLPVRKLGLPGHEEFAMGAIAGGGIRVLNMAAIRAHRIGRAPIDAACAREEREIARRERQYRGARPEPGLAGRTAILVDDGLATGSTMCAAVRAAHARGAARVVVAVPAGAPDSCAALAAQVDELVCLVRPADFGAVSRWYREFGQTSDEEVQDLLAIAWRDQALAQRSSTNASERRQS
ncbi:phosphoribosyltransferase [Massilia sp. P8910]|uniref:phosphoribosyltransferase n=1 Tax=Massilia antarctica TaxID=2765360 RepID=UPI0006BB89A8|nr:MULTISPECIES: phosphoribosyltransferase family protein [Massilia]MCE3607439.1 phosphoribosyltransferase [Massilia antarctica]MCY0912563.1 phosphoribosyltransferase family protein [Massilia sp. H27-R4]CUI03616.1 Phosphoribosyl transferase domain protein [Janthinobacterium sp. CG23_2]CUU27402.1 Phosphoribosyl transferase domain protein [Janthinobacterium sp. CG23_2]